MDNSAADLATLSKKLGDTITAPNRATEDPPQTSTPKKAATPNQIKNDSKSNLSQDDLTGIVDSESLEKALRFSTTDLQETLNEFPQQ